MAVPSNEELVYNLRLTSVGPGQVTGSEVVHEPTGLDLAMKLHYLRAVYLFDKETSEGVTLGDIKDAMFTLFNDYYYTAGRFRRNDAGRPYVKCNDCGARFVEAKSDKTVEEWAELLMEDGSLDRLLAYQQFIGPEIVFSPPVYLQVTCFEGGGMSLGLSWAHVLGDPFSASKFINTWGRILTYFKSKSELRNYKSSRKLKTCPCPYPYPYAYPYPYDGMMSGGPLSIKRVDPVGDLWIIPYDIKMETFSFCLSVSQITHLQENMFEQTIPPFEAISATIWQSIAKNKDNDELRIVTICKRDLKMSKNDIQTNTQIISIVKTKTYVADANVNELAKLMLKEAVDERKVITEDVEKDNGVSDFIMYGTNLTFVDLEEADLYSLEVNGHKPIFVRYTIQGIGNKGVVLVFPQLERADKGKVVTVTLPENDILRLKNELKKNGLLL